MKERIRRVMEYAQMSQQDFAVRLGISPASLSSIFTGRTNPTNNHVNAVHVAFPEININWLMFGEGEMIIATPDAGGDGIANDSMQRASLPDEGAVFADGSSLNQLSTELITTDKSIPIRPGQEKLPPSKYLAYPDTAVIHQTSSDVRVNAIKIDKPQRKIKEIRVFFDDGTYESFVPSSK